MTTETFQSLIRTYMEAWDHVRWVSKNIDAFALETPEQKRSALTAAMDQENAALRDLVQASQGMIGVFKTKGKA